MYEINVIIHHDHILRKLPNIHAAISTHYIELHCKREKKMKKYLIKKIFL